MRSNRVGCDAGSTAIDTGSASDERSGRPAQPASTRIAQADHSQRPRIDNGGLDTAGSISPRGADAAVEPRAGPVVFSPPPCAAPGALAGGCV